MVGISRSGPQDDHIDSSLSETIVRPIKSYPSGAYRSFTENNVASRETRRAITCREWVLVSSGF